MKAYQRTEINWTRSQAGIIQLLQKRGIAESRFTNMADRFILEFRVVENGVAKPLAVRIIVPALSDEKDLNRMYRVLFYHLKAKFIAIDNGLTEFIEEFMSHLVITNQEGKTTTMGSMILPQYKNQLESGEQKEFKMLN